MSLVLSHHSPSQSNPASTHSPLSYQVRLEYLVVYRIYSALLNILHLLNRENKRRYIIIVVQAWYIYNITL